MTLQMDEILRAYGVYKVNMNRADIAHKAYQKSSAYVGYKDNAKIANDALKEIIRSSTLMYRDQVKFFEGKLCRSSAAPYVVLKLTQGSQTHALFAASQL